MSEDIIFSLQGVNKVVPPKKVVLKDIYLSFYAGAKIGVLGLNGAGKSSLLRVIAGEDKDYTGEAVPKKGITIGHLTQEPELDDDADVRANVELGLGEITALLKRFDEISARFAEPMSDDEMNDLLIEQGECQSKIDAVDGWDVQRKLDIAAEALRLPPWDTSVKHLSGGERRRVALCKLLLSRPDILLLDEPTNHLDAESVAWLERFLQEYEGTVIAVTHDRYFLDHSAEWILELDRGEAYPYKGNYSAWLEQKEQRLAQEAKQQESKKKALADELEWVRTQSKGRHAKNKARLSRYEEMSSQSFQKRNETRELYIPPGPKLGEKVLEIEGLNKSFGDKLLIDSLNIVIPRAAVVGIIGSNGAGKSTFFKMLSGQEKPDSGTISFGESVQMAYVDQSRDHLNDNNTVWQEISDGLDEITVGDFATSSRAYVGRFNFKGQDQQKHIGNLSGGERNRVHLAKLLRSGGNVLLLDEPSNDLDVETLRALEQAILNFPGCVLVISHDRWFLDRIATHILAFEGDSKVTLFEGNFTEYAEDKKKRLGIDITDPKRIKYKKIETV